MLKSKNTDDNDESNAKPSPNTKRFQGVILRYLRVWWSIIIGKVIESVQTKTIPMNVNRTPAISN
jgi:hypothetical protein